MTAQIVTTQSEGIKTIRINRPDKKNALTMAMYAAMADALARADEDPKTRVVLITGSGDSFTAGNDLNDFLDNPPTDPSSPVFRFMHAMADFHKPVVAAVNGIAIGIGTTMLLHCDLAYAVVEARFQMPFVNLGLVPEFASSLLLPRLLGNARAAEIFMLGNPFDGQTAAALGLINGTFTSDKLESMVRTKAAALATKPPEALRQTKALLRASPTEIKTRIDVEAKTFGLRLQSPELKEAIAAFFEKRAPDFSQFD